MLKKSCIYLFNDQKIITDVTKFDYYCNTYDQLQSRIETQRLLYQQQNHTRCCYGYSLFSHIFNEENNNDDGKNDEKKPCGHQIIGYVCCNSEPIVYYCQIHKNLILTMLRCECGSNEIYGYVNNNKLFGVCANHQTLSKYKPTFIRADYTLCDIE